MKPVEPAGEIQVPNNYQAAVEVVVTEEETSSLIEHSNLVQPDVSALAEQEIASQIVHNNINQDQQENDEGFLQGKYCMSLKFVYVVDLWHYTNVSYSVNDKSYLGKQSRKILKMTINIGCYPIYIGNSQC